MMRVMHPARAEDRMSGLPKQVEGFQIDMDGAGLADIRAKSISGASLMGVAKMRGQARKFRACPKRSVADTGQCPIGRWSDGA